MGGPQKGRHRLGRRLVGDYVDLRLPPQERIEAGCRIGRDPSWAGRAVAYAAQGEALHALYDGVLSEPVPARLTRLMPARRRREAAALPRTLRRLAAGFMLGACVAAAGSAGWAARGAQEARQNERQLLRAFVSSAIDAHSLYALDTRRLEGEDAQRALAAWLTDRLGIEPVRGVALAGSGLTFQGGRLLPAPAGEAAAQLVFRDPQGRLVGVYLQARAPKSLQLELPQLPARGPAGPVFLATVKDTSVFYWRAGPAVYALTADMEREELSRLAQALMLGDGS